MEIDREAECAILRVLPREASVNAEREDLNVEVEAAGWAADEQFVGTLARDHRLSIGAVSKYLQAVRAAGISAAEAESLS